MRPGPIQGGAVHPYIERRKRLREDPSYEVPYEHPSLEPALRDTLGAIVFQDQVLEVAMALAGFSVGEAEGLRRAMSRKRSEAAMLRYRERFIEGAVGRGVSREVAERVFGQIEGFSGFGFPKAHSAAFGLLAYQSTWLRVHYGPELLCAPAQRAADGLLSAGRAGARGAAARGRDPAAGRQCERGRLPGGDHGSGGRLLGKSAGADRARIRGRADGGRCRRRWSRSGVGAALSQRLGPRRPLGRRGGCAAAAGLGRGLRFAGRGPVSGVPRRSRSRI